MDILASKNILGGQFKPWSPRACRNPQASFYDEEKQNTTKEKTQEIGDVGAQIAPAYDQQEQNNLLFLRGADAAKIEGQVKASGSPMQAWLGVLACRACVLKNSMLAIPPLGGQSLRLI